MLQTQASFKECLKRVPLPAQAIHHVCAGLDERRFEHVGQEREDAVERLVISLGSSFGVNFAVGDASEHFGEDGEVEDERGGK